MAHLIIGLVTGTIIGCLISNLFASSKISESDYQFMKGYRKAFREVINRIDEGFCNICPHSCEGCSKECEKNGWEYETLFKWLKERTK